jgi:hypothetical protein
MPTNGERETYRMIIEKNQLDMRANLYYRKKMLTADKKVSTSKRDFC